MKVYETSDIRNVALVGHGHSGKTSLAAGLLFTSGATNRLTRVDEGNTITDFDDEEMQRKITISTAVAAAEWNKKKINLIDTPGFNIFISDTKASLVAADAAFVVVDGVAGVEVQTEKVWTFADEFNLPARHHHQQARSRALQLRAGVLKASSSSSAAPVFRFISPSARERDFKGVVDLVRMKSYTYTNDGDGKGKEADIPADLAGGRAEGARSADRNGGRRQRRAARGIFRQRHACRSNTFSTVCATPSASCAFSRCCAPPVFTTSSSDLMLNFAVDYFPGPADRGPWKGER